MRHASHTGREAQVMWREVHHYAYVDRPFAAVARPARPRHGRRPDAPAMG